MLFLRSKCEKYNDLRDSKKQISEYLSELFPILRRNLHSHFHTQSTSARALAGSIDCLLTDRDQVPMYAINEIL